MLVQAANSRRVARLDLATSRLLPWHLELLQHLVEYCDPEIGEAEESGAAPQSGAGKRMSDGSVSFVRKEIYESYISVVVQPPYIEPRAKAERPTSATRLFQIQLRKESRHT